MQQVAQQQFFSQTEIREFIRCIKKAIQSPSRAKL